MSRTLSLAHLTAISLTPPELIEAAARVGFDAVGLRLIRVTETSPGYPLMDDPAMMRATKAALRETGLRVNDIEFVKIEPEIDIPALATFLEAGAELGASEVICAPYDHDLSRLADRLGTLSDLAGQFGLGISLEFFPWTVVPDLSTAHEVVSQANQNVAILVDALHFDRSNSTREKLRDIPADRLRLAHLCDAAVQSSYSEDELLLTARAERLPPGQGQIDLSEFLAALRPDLTIGVEVPMTCLARAEGIENVLTKVMEATRRTLGHTSPTA